MSQVRCRQVQRDPLEYRWVNAGSHGIFTQGTGGGKEGAPVVLVHGQVVSSRYMVPLAKELASDFSVLAPDLPGFGRSSKPPETLSIPQHAEVLALWMESLDVDRAMFFGNSFGCQILIEFALRYPERVTRIVLQGPTVDPEARTVYQQGGRWLLDCLLEDPSFALVMTQDYLAAGMRRAWETFQNLLQDPIEAKLPDVTVPALVVRGTRDSIVPQRWAETAAELLPQGQLLVCEGAPHAMNYSTPAELARLIRPFLQKGGSPD